MKLNEDRFNPETAEWLKRAAKCGTGTRDRDGKAWRTGYLNEFPMDDGNQFIRLAHYGFLRLADDGMIHVLDVSDNDGYGE